QNNGTWGFIDNGSEKTKIVGLLNGKAFIRGELSALAGAVKISGSIKGDARLGIGFEYQNLPSEVSNQIYGGDIRLYGEACYKTFWGVGPSKCVESDDWYSDYFGNLAIFGKTNGNNPFQNFESFTFKDTGTLVLPDFHPQPSFGTRGDTLYAVWLEHNQNDGYILFSKLNNSINEFTDEKIVVNNSNSISNPRVAILPSGSAIITWSQNRYNEVTLPSGSDEFDLMQAQDVWFAIYDNDLDSIVYVQKLDDDETSTQSGRAEGEALVTVGDNNDAMITWVVTDALAITSDIYYTHLTETTDAWEITAPDILSDLPGVNSNVGVVYTDSASVLTVWVNDPDGNEDTYNSEMIFAEWDGNSWTPAQTLATNDGATKLNELSLASNDGYVAFAWTSSHFDTNNEFENRLDMLVYDAVNQDWDMNSTFSDTDSNYYFQLPVASISKTGKATICYQVIDMYADTNYIPNGELYLFVKDLNATSDWQEITENAYLCDTNTFIWDLTAGFAANDKYYVITQEYNDNGVVTNPVNGVKFGDPDLSLVLRGIQLNSDNTVGDIEEPGNVSAGIKDLNSRTDFRFLNAYPNPFNDITVIEYQLENNANVQLEVYDFLGNKVAELVNTNLGAGIYKTIFKAGDLPGGVYFNRLTVNGRTITRKLVLVK
ncbi:MAG: T9SS C-terminal target domain-containing protein, partial [Crocinitomicaceae bacterium]|nr:T9SS C-terminal target domain-containing protein [Crocinitomicaceae bacterium]